MNLERTNFGIGWLAWLDTAVGAVYPIQVSCALVGPTGIKVLLFKFYPQTLFPWLFANSWLR